MKIGIFFGGQSREREVSFAGGRTVYDNLDKNLFEPIPIFVDSLGNFILLEWQYIYKGTIRDFYPPARFLPTTTHKIQLYIESLAQLSAEELQKIINEVGKPITPIDFKTLFDFAFLALHGQYGEDGNIQGILEWYGIPYSGSGILPSAIGIDKIVQSQILQQAGFKRPKQLIISQEEWQKYEQAPTEWQKLLQKITQQIGFPVVVKSPQQGSSIGVTIVHTPEITDLKKALQKSFFQQTIENWHQKTPTEKQTFLLQFTDIREGLGFPVIDNKTKETLYTAQALYDYLEASPKAVTLSSIHTEPRILLEEHIKGKEFSCIVIQAEDGTPIALPPTEIRKYNELFDYRSKYLPGTSRKITPIEIASTLIAEIREACEKLFRALQCNVYARIDGFITPDNQIYLNDPNTTSGMMPSSFFFHQAAEIGLNSKDFLTYIIRTSLAERIKTGKNTWVLQKQLQEIDEKIKNNRIQQTQKIPVAVLMGGYSTERHISMESGRNIYEKLSSSTKYLPFPVFVMGNDQAHELYEIPVNYMLKDNADDIRDKIKADETGQKQQGSEILNHIIAECQNITEKYVGHSLKKPQKISYAQLAERTKLVFIALHGRPGEDGAVQTELEKYGIAYNGSGAESSQKTINKYETNEILRKNGILVASHALIYQTDWEKDAEKVIHWVKEQFQFPIIAKPADDGCSSAVKKIKNEAQLRAFAAMMFRPEPEFLEDAVQTLGLKRNEEFPQKNYFLIEALIERQNADYFLEITGGMLSTENGFEVFAPSEALATGDVLSLEEKFLAGEGQNITPARYATDNPTLNAQIEQEAQKVLQRTAELLGVEGYCRIDAFVRVYREPLKIEIIIIEINSLPGMTPATCIFHQAALNQYKPYQFIDKILEYGQKKAHVLSTK
ncbi:MAG: D-alanine--D-alanine ligase [Cytophagales bacterium]|nr:MAG: D-alanine--D-alanine ligase [Cytophagales bacterium]